MRVLELLEEIEEIVDTAAGFPLTGKIMVDSQELLEIVREIRAELPDEIQQAQWIKNERERIIAEARTQYEAVIEDAQKQADTLVENNDITVKAKLREHCKAAQDRNVRLPRQHPLQLPGQDGAPQLDLLRGDVHEHRKSLRRHQFGTGCEQGRAQGDGVQDAGGCGRHACPVKV